MSDNYTPYVSKTALDSMPLVLPGNDVSTVVTGSDSAAHANEIVANEPTATKNESILDKIFGVPQSAIDIKNQARQEGTGPYLVGQKWFDANTKKILYAALFVVVGLLLISRGFGLIGEEGSDVIVNLGDPTKFPGIGHAVRGLKKKGG